MKKNKKAFSKSLLVQESILIWIMTLGFLGLAFICIFKNFTGSLPWLAAMASFPWTAYGVSQIYYYKKSLAENTKDGIIFETALADINKNNELYNQTYLNNYSAPNDSINTESNTSEIDPFGPI